MTLTPRQRRRGQATTELALGSLVFVTVLMMGIYFAEVGHLSLEVVHAASSALFDTTAEKMHRVWDPAAQRADWSLYRVAVANAGPRATARHASFDSRARQVFTQAAGLQVRCDESGGVPSQAAGLPGFPAGDSGMTCEARAELTSVRIPTRLADDAQGLFAAQHWAARRLEVCAAGRAVATGGCGGSYGLLLDDWGLAGDDEARECRIVGGCDNPGFFDLARRTYGAGVNIYSGSAQALLDHVTSGARPLPMEEGKFRMSFRGSESLYLEQLPGSHGDTLFETTAYEWPSQYATPRSTCWLGDPC